jgi:hypothetical protein
LKRDFAALLGEYRNQANENNDKFERMTSEMDMLCREVVFLGTQVRNVDERCPCSLSDEERESRNAEYVPLPVVGSPTPVPERIAVPLPVPAPEVGADTSGPFGDSNIPPF